ncbi:MAG: hypothetical protein KatS3mg064_0425 [Tepidiforma sp.]|nr:maleylpyruvate isomerase N-terminal domain-containing protein [Tepidiforma sp.]GIW17268.1 MAG: hypothetical protein KatS3mg064_0425 [Tepidiforma sp.]
MPDLDAIVRELDAHRERFEAFCRSLSTDELDRPVPQSTWLVRDFIAHLATIDGPVAEMFRAVRRGEDGGIRTPDGARFDVDDWNELRVQERRARSVEELLDEARREREALKRDLLALTPEDLERPLRFAGDAKRPPATIPLGMYLAGWCKHDPMHVVDMCRALPGRAEELRDWLDDPVVARYQAAMNQAG